MQVTGIYLQSLLSCCSSPGTSSLSVFLVFFFVLSWVSSLCSQRPVLGGEFRASNVYSAGML